MSVHRWRSLSRIAAFVCLGAGLLAGLAGPASVASAQPATDCNQPRQYTEDGLTITMTVCGKATFLGQSSTYDWNIEAWELLTVSDSRGFDEGLVGCELGVTADRATTAPRMPSFGSCLNTVNTGEARWTLGSTSYHTGALAQPDWRVTFTVRFASNGGPVRMLAVRRDIPLPQE
jgi:hypothetical protein